MSGITNGPNSNSQGSVGVLPTDKELRALPQKSRTQEIDQAQTSFAKQFMEKNYKDMKFNIHTIPAQFGHVINQLIDTLVDFSTPESLVHKFPQIANDVRSNSVTAGSTAPNSTTQALGPAAAKEAAMAGTTDFPQGTSLGDRGYGPGFETLLDYYQNYDCTAAQTSKIVAQMQMVLEYKCRRIKGMMGDLALWDNTSSLGEWFREVRKSDSFHNTARSYEGKVAATGGSVSRLINLNDEIGDLYVRAEAFKEKHSQNKAIFDRARSFKSRINTEVYDNITRVANARHGWNQMPEVPGWSPPGKAKLIQKLDQALVSLNNINTAIKADSTMMIYRDELGLSDSVRSVRDVARGLSWTSSGTLRNKAAAIVDATKDFWNWTPL
jgi:hypothetical protein